MGTAVAGYMILQIQEYASMRVAAIARVSLVRCSLDLATMLEQELRQAERPEPVPLPGPSPGPDQLKVSGDGSPRHMSRPHTAHRGGDASCRPAATHVYCLNPGPSYRWLADEHRNTNAAGTTESSRAGRVLICRPAWPPCLTSALCTWLGTLSAAPASTRSVFPPLFAQNSCPYG